MIYDYTMGTDIAGMFKTIMSGNVLTGADAHSAEGWIAIQPDRPTGVTNLSLAVRCP